MITWMPRTVSASLNISKPATGSENITSNLHVLVSTNKYVERNLKKLHLEENELLYGVSDDVIGDRNSHVWCEIHVSEIPFPHRAPNTEIIDLWTGEPISYTYE